MIFEFKKEIKANHAFSFKLSLLSLNFSGLISKNLVCTFSSDSSGATVQLCLCISVQDWVLVLSLTFTTKSLLPTVESSLQLGTVQIIMVDFHNSEITTPAKEVFLLSLSLLALASWLAVYSAETEDSTVFHLFMLFSKLAQFSDHALR